MQFSINYSCPTDLAGNPRPGGLSALAPRPSTAAQRPSTDA